MTTSYSQKSSAASARSGKAIDLSHHLSDVSKLRKLSPFEDLLKFRARPGMITLAGGLPDPAYFPFASISADTLVADSFALSKPTESSLFSWLWNIFGAGSTHTEKTERFSVPKYSAQKTDVDLSSSLQYGMSAGLLPLQTFLRDFTGKVFQPGYSDWTTIVNVGNTNGIHRALSTLCNPGERILVEERTYPSVLSSALPMGVAPISVRVDGQGMSVTDLEYILSTWNETVRGGKRPHVMYTIPVGQNPTGATMGAERKKAIYDICVTYDIIIIEDDPYHFLQEGKYKPKHIRTQSPSRSKGWLKKGEEEDEVTRYLHSLEPSFIKFDYQGRVVRLDTFSKIIAPGSRLGWFTCNPIFGERLEWEGETTVEGPCGFSQSLLTHLLTNQWGFPNFIRWLQGLQTQYTIRRDYFVDCVFNEFDVRPAEESNMSFGAGGVDVMTAYVKTKGTRKMSEEKKAPLFSFVPPSAGMFVWLKLHVKPPVTTQPTNHTQTMSDRVWTDLAQNGLLVAPGSQFAAVPELESGPASLQGEIPIRLSFSNGTQATMKAGVKILADVLGSYVL